jgi:hypothetical protein
MSYEDIVKAQAKGGAKEAAAAVNGKRGRKRKSPAPAGALEVILVPLSSKWRFLAEC